MTIPRNRPPSRPPPAPLPVTPLNAASFGVIDSKGRQDFSLCMYWSENKEPIIQATVVTSHVTCTQTSQPGESFDDKGAFSEHSMVCSFHLLFPILTTKTSDGFSHLVPTVFTWGWKARNRKKMNPPRIAFSAPSLISFKKVQAGHSSPARSIWWHHVELVFCLSLFYL